ncbi:nucleoside-diphosphate kinase [Patescibacteria group bacterium]|nr:nucleoside-diphosphate kinase [Patescibacteria group bacterium]MBU4452792.1 nucleoside-diphosphate kinase [Patescibacteria group bacterium]MCG2687576.1 nucleoside-diphosphate kinase [Candidatus Parcubacteria bacterium]
MADVQRTLVLIKPDAVQRELVGRVIERFEQKGLKIVAMKLAHLDEVTLTEHYGHLKEKPFFNDLLKFMMQTPVVAMIWEGIGVIDEVRKIVGSTNPREADAGTIRADMSMNVPSNMVHASDSFESAVVEIKRFFKDEEVFTYEKLTDRFHFGEGI